MRGKSEEGASFEAPEAPWRVRCGEGLSLPPGEASGQAVARLPRFFWNFWFKMGHFCSKLFLCSAKGGIAPPQKHTPLNTVQRNKSSSIHSYIETDRLCITLYYSSTQNKTKKKRKRNRSGVGEETRVGKPRVKQPCTLKNSKYY